MKRISIWLLMLLVALGGCTKEANRKALKGYFSYEVSGKKVLIEDEILLLDNTFECNVVGDSVLYIHATKVYQGGGFIIRLGEGGTSKDGSYVLDSRNKGFYENATDKRIYYTNDNFKGTLTLKNGVFQGKSLINTLQGTFEFEGVDVSTNKSFKVTNGSFLMERKIK